MIIQAISSLTMPLMPITNGLLTKMEVKLRLDKDNIMKHHPSFRVPLLAVSLTVSVLLSGCQSLPSSNTATKAAVPNVNPKAMVVQALKSQRKQSFSYHSNIEIAAPIASNRPLAVASSADTHCQTVHDNAYINLIKQAEATKTDLYDERFEARRSQIKANYVTCFEAYQAWLRQQDGELQAADKKYASLIKMFDNYPLKQSQSDLKKRQLLNEYGLKPLSINAQGNYQPLAGKMTLLASVQYHAKNHQSQVNQPIYIDLKSGQLYLWADHAAYITSQLFDDKLGTAWKNKWLRIDLADGSLPKGFGKALIQNHFAALDTMLDAMPATEFSYIAPTELGKLNFTLPSHQLSVMQSGAVIVRQQQSVNTQIQNYQTYLNTFYDKMSQQFPELVSDDSHGMTQQPSLSEASFDSKMLAKLMLSGIKAMASSEEITAKSGDIEERFYGFDNRKRLVWQQVHSFGGTQTSTVGDQADNLMAIDVFSQFLPLSRETNFVNLPKDSQVPTAANSIDVKEYSKELLSRYKEGGGATFGKIIFGTVSGRLAMFSDTTPSDSDSLEEAPLE